jgi:hypothetical protein
MVEGEISLSDPMQSLLTAFPSKDEDFDHVMEG